MCGMRAYSWAADMAIFQGIRMIFITREEFDLLTCGWLRPEDALGLKAKAL